MKSESSRATPDWRSALEQTGVGLIAQTNVEDGHSWVRRAPTGDKALDEIEWCQWCGTHKLEVPDWMDNPLCRGLKAIRDAIVAPSESVLRKHAVTVGMYEAGLRYLRGRGTAWDVTDLYLAMEEARVSAE